MLPGEVWQLVLQRVTFGTLLRTRLMSSVLHNYTVLRAHLSERQLDFVIRISIYQNELAFLQQLTANFTHFPLERLTLVALNGNLGMLQAVVDCLKITPQQLAAIHSTPTYSYYDTVLAQAAVGYDLATFAWLVRYCKVDLCGPDMTKLVDFCLEKNAANILDWIHFRQPIQLSDKQMRDAFWYIAMVHNSSFVFNFLCRTQHMTPDLAVQYFQRVRSGGCRICSSRVTHLVQLVEACMSDMASRINAIFL